MKTFFLSLVFSLVMGSVVYSQSRSVIKINPISLAQGTFSASFERAFSVNRSFQINFDYHRERYFEDRYTGLGITGEYRFYGIIPGLVTADQTAPDGFFAGPAAGFRSIRYVDSFDPDFTESYQIFQVGGVAGYQWLPKSKDGVQRFSLEGSIGLLAALSFGEDTDLFGMDFGLGSRFNSGFIPTFSLSVGYAFGRK